MQQPSSSDAPGDADLEASLRTVWDARVIAYDLRRFPFAERVLEAARRLGHRVEALDRLHETVPRDEVYALTKALCDATHEPGFRRLVRDFVLTELVPACGLQPPLGVQRFLNVRVMLPDTPQGVFPFHTGLLYGHGPAARSLWLPLTDVTHERDRSASLQIIGLDRSRELARHAAARALTIDEMTELFGRESRGVRAGPGQALLFTQEHIHGNFVNRTGRTRVSIDFRVAEARYGEHLARKIPGGYFELLPDSTAEPRSADAPSLANDRPNVVYLNNNTSSTREVPVHLQRLQVREYCERHRLPFEFELFELETMDHLPTLRHILEQLRCNALMYSIYALPADRARRAELYEAARAGGTVLHFANEGLALVGDADRARVEALLAFAKYGRG